MAWKAVRRVPADMVARYERENDAVAMEAKIACEKTETVGSDLAMELFGKQKAKRLAAIVGRAYED